MISLTSIFLILLATYSVFVLIIHFVCARKRASSYAPVDVLNAVMTAILGLMGWRYTSTTYVDLDRMMEEVATAREQGLSTLLSTYSMNPLSAVILLLGYGGDRRILQCFGTVVSYGLIFVTIGIVKRRLRLSTVATLLGTDAVLLCFNFVTAATNIRFPIALWLTTVAIALYGPKRAWLSIVLFLGAVLIHVGIVVLPVLFLIVTVFRARTIRILVCAAGLIYYQFSAAVVRMLMGMSNHMLSQMGERLSYYVGLSSNYESTYDAMAIESGGRTPGVIFVLLAILAVVVYLLLAATQPNFRPMPANVLWFTLACLCFTIGSYNSYTIFIRYATILMYLVALLLVFSLNQYFELDELRAIGYAPPELTGNSLAIVYWVPVTLGVMMAYFLKRATDVYHSSYLLL